MCLTGVKFFIRCLWFELVPFFRSNNWISRISTHQHDFYVFFYKFRQPKLVKDIIPARRLDLCYILLSCVFVLSQIFPSFKPREFQKITQSNCVFHLVVCHYRRTSVGEREEVSE